MRAVICDHCDKRQPATSYGNPPTGWLSITTYDDNAPNIEQQFCSSACASLALNGDSMLAHKRLMAEETR
jgi:hypothetical protein